MTPIDATAITAGSRVAAPVVAAGGESIVNWLKRKYGNVKHIKGNFKKLQDEIQLLIVKEADVQGELRSFQSTKEPTEECKTWLKRVSEIRLEIEQLEYDYDNKPSIYFCGLCPYRALHNLGKRIVKKTEEATALKKETPTTIMRERPAIPCGNRWNNGDDDVRIVNYSSFEKHVATLLGWLNEEGFTKICIYGPPGVGKTTILRTVHEQVRQTGGFDYTFSVTVTRENIQELIWKGLGMTMDGNGDPDQRANKISEMLKDKKFVLFLDEVSSSIPIDLKKVGINPPDHKLGKVIFACREKYTGGDTDEDIKVETLSREDATILFWEFAKGSHPERSKEIEHIAEIIINHCGGMPAVLKLIGKHLAKKEQTAHWEDMKYKLQSPNEQKWEEWEEYYRSLKLVYEDITNEKKHCLLYWAIFPPGEEINRDYIIDCWTAEQFLGRTRLRIKRNRGITILDDFMERSLLDKGEILGHLKMSYCFQRAALRIANSLERDAKFFVENDKEIECCDQWIKAKRVSLARMTGLLPLPENPLCRGMLTLLLHENDLTEFPVQFFENMGGLKVLGLREEKIRGLPPSISGLRNLRGLFLNNRSQVVELPRQIGNLQNLEILDVTGIYSLPNEVGKLKNLRCLRVSFIEAGGIQNHVQGDRKVFCFRNSNSSCEQMIPHSTISKLTNLEELSLDVSPSNGRWDENADAIAEEITELEKLTHLQFYYTKLESFNTFIAKSKGFKGFRTFRLIVGQQRNSSPSEFDVFECSSEKHLKYSEGDGFAEAISSVLKQAKSFELIGHTASNLTDNLPSDALQELEAFIVEECNEMQTIVKGNIDTTTGEGVFKRLQMLHLKGLPRLVRIWEGTIPSESFRALTTLTLRECHGITILFSLEMVAKLSQLENLQIEDCSKIEKIFEAESETTVESISMALAKLKNFRLCRLESLTSISDIELKWPALETIFIQTCQVPRTGLPSTGEKAPKLRDIQIQ